MLPKLLADLLDARSQATARREMESYRQALVAGGMDPAEAEAEAGNMLIERVRANIYRTEQQGNVAAANTAAIPRRVQILGERAAESEARTAERAGDQRRARAIRELQRLNNLIAQHDDAMRRAGLSGADGARGARDRDVLLGEIRRQSGLLSSEFDDLLEHDEAGWPTRLRQRGQAAAQGSGAQTQAAPPTQQQGRGRYNGQRIARAPARSGAASRR